MATSRAQSQLCRYFSFLILALILSGRTEAKDFEPSRFQLIDGAKFYLLSEETFGSGENAKIRLEAQPYAASANSGVDLRLYRVPNPLKFLEAQKNLHRPKTEGIYRGEGIRNAVHFVWDVIYKKSRLVWQRILSATTRQKAVTANPSFKQIPAHTYKTPLENNPQFGFLPGYTLVQSFRYPLQFAKPIAPKDVKLDGSSSNFLAAKEGTIYVPFGKLAPGLYIVEGILGKYRANCLLFVSDTVAVTKISSDELFAWTVNRTTGKKVTQAKLNFTDGLGRLGSGVTDGSGVYALKKKDLERAYVFGEDKDGGVFVSENFYYDSEIYAHKIYIVTDRPLYRPGETVFFKGVGRDFKNSLDSVVLPDGKAKLTIMDPSGLTVWQKNLTVSQGTVMGSFPLPTEAVSGGYELNLQVHGKEHTSFIRVANFVKPHFEVDVDLEEKNLSVGKPIEALVTMRYPNGLPVKAADVEVIVRKQRLTMVEGELQGLEAFPVELKTSEMKSDAKGMVKIAIPAMDFASRLIIQVKATDEMSYRVNKSKEVLVTSESGFLEIIAENEFSAPGKEVEFKIQSQEGKKKVDLDGYKVEIIRLEDQSKEMTEVDGDEFEHEFKKPGNYAIHLVKNNLVVATSSHWVEGEGLGTVNGTIDIVFDKDIYQPGEMAKFFINFPENVDEALVTLERDKVERFSLASEGKDWLTLKKTSPKSFSGSLKVEEFYAPNMTFSVVYVRGGKFVFQNKGIQVEVPKINISVSFDKPRYLPGETVTMEIETTLKGRAIASELAVGVVDETIYSLQAELGPTIFDFFYHVRRNQVKTSASLAFHSFDAAVSAVDLGTPENTYQDRSIKLMKDRARREDKDTAYWKPDLKTDGDGKTKVTFRMPDSITKWRVTARAHSGNFSVGQRTALVESFKSFYHTYVGPKYFRKGDKPDLHYLIFNNTGKDAEIELDIGSAGKKSLKVGREPAYLNFDKKWDNETELSSDLIADGKSIDKLKTAITVDEKAWLSDFVLASGEKIPADAKKIRAYPMNSSSEKVLSALDTLWEYPYGCVEQTSSRLLPLALAYTALEKSSATGEVLPKIQRRIASARGRLVRMAGPNADFTWWGDLTGGSLLMKVYAFYTDFYASKSLGIDLPKANWESLLVDYKDKSGDVDLSQRALILWMMGEMGLPVKTLAKGLLEKYPVDPKDSAGEEESSLYFDHQLDGNSWAMTLVLADVILDKTGVPDDKLKTAKDILKGSPYLLGKAALALHDKTYRDANLEEILTGAANEMQPTFDRSMTLALLWESLKITSATTSADLPAPWVKKENGMGFPYYVFDGKGSPTELDQKNFKYSFQSASPVNGKLPMKITRRFYHLKKLPVEEGEEDESVGVQFELGEEVKNGKFSASELYVDRVEISTSSPYAFSLIEIPLVSGMELETQTWGISVKDGADAVTIGSGKPGSFGNTYVVPVDMANGEMSFYNLVRPEVNGKFVLPPVRFHRMYAPHLMAFEGETKLDFKNVTVD